MSLNYIFHLSDLHIRNGDKISCRYDEYNGVFNNTIISIKNKIDELKLTFNDFIIIISGDVFHHKNSIENYSLLLYKNFIEKLVKLGRVIIFHGNHDKNQSEIDQPSLVYSSSFNIENLTILNDTTTFNIDNIGFSYVSIDDTLDIYRNSGRIQDLPRFPEIIGDVKYKIGLFHGPIQGMKTDLGFDFGEEAYDVEKFDGLETVLCGDIHKRQVFDIPGKKKAYMIGSTIQQNFGEKITKHGYGVYDIEKDEYDFVDLPNPKPFLSFYINSIDNLVDGTEKLTNY